MKILKGTGQGKEYEVIVDDEFNHDKAINIDYNGYPRIRVNNKVVSLHRFITKAKRGDSVDHINGNKLDNRLENLRVCTHKQNMANRKHKGVYFLKQKKRFIARVKTNGKHTYVGSFKLEEDAIKAYQKAHAELFKEFSPYHKEESK